MNAKRTSIHRTHKVRLLLAAVVVATSLTAAATPASAEVHGSGTLWSRNIADGTVRSWDIRNNTILSRDVHDGTLMGADIRAGSLDGGEIRDGGIRGVDIARRTIGGEQLAIGEITTRHLAFNVASQNELDRLAGRLSLPGTINAFSNPMDWTKLKGVPAGFADGVDNKDGGIAADLVCSGCIGSEDLADGSIALGDLAYDPATQTEFDGLVADLAAADGTVNEASDKVDWTKLKTVPVGFADGVDNTDGGIAADVMCTGCVDSTDVADGSVTVGDLAYDPATQPELDSLGAAGSINTASNPVDWTRLKTVPAGFADGTDAVDGGIAADLMCTGCVDATDIADGSVTVADLAYDPATQTELDSLGAAGTINTASNPVDWTRLKSVPVGFADGVDAVDGGIAADVMCTGCVDATDIANGSVTVADLAYDPATQTELDSLGVAGSINTASNPVDWTKLKSVPAGFSDGADDGVTSVSATGPLASSGGLTPTISITQANATTAGYLSAADWSTFNGKLGTVSIAAGSGLAGDGTAASPLRLLGTCTDGQVLKSTTGTWACANDTDTSTAYTAGTGLSLTGTTFSIASTYALPQTCASGEVTKWNGTAWACGIDAIADRKGGFTSNDVGTSVGTAATAVVTSPAVAVATGGQLMAQASGTLTNTTAGALNVTCQVFMDASTAVSAPITQTVPGNTSTVMSAVGGVAAAAGSHTAELRCSAGATGVTFSKGNIIAWDVAA